LRMRIRLELGKICHWLVLHLHRPARNGRYRATQS
jgi:hypothetical protein